MKILYKILHICSLILLFSSTTNAVTYQDIKTNYQNANSAVNGLLNFSSPRIGWALNSAFNNEYNNTKTKLTTTYDNMTKYNNETINSQEIRTILEGAGTISGLLRWASPKINEYEDNYGRTFLTKARDELKKALDKFPVPLNQLEQSPLKNNSLVTIKVKGRYLDADRSKVASGGPIEAKLKNKLDSKNQIFIVRTQGPYAGFQSIKSSTKAGKFLEIDSSTKKPAFKNSSWDAGKFFRIIPVSGKANTYNMKYIPTKTFVKQYVNSLIANDTSIDRGTYFEFEIKEFSLDNPSAQRILNPGFYRPDLVTIKNIGQNKYLSSSYNEAGLGGNINQSRSLKLLNKPNSLTSVFKIAKSDQSLTRIDPNYRDWFEKPGYPTWFSFVNTYRLGFNGGERGLLDIGTIADGGYFLLNTTAGTYRNFKLSRVPNVNKEYYLIKNQQHNKFLRLSGDKLIADMELNQAASNQNCWFEIGKFRINPNLYILYGETEKFRLSKAGNGYIKFQVKTPDSLDVKLLDNNNNQIGLLKFSTNYISGTFQRRDFRLMQNNIIDPNKWNPFWIAIKNQELSIGTGNEPDKNTLRLGTDTGKFETKIKITNLSNVVSFRFIGQTNQTKKTMITKPIMIEAPVIDRPQPGEGKTLIKLDPGYYKIKNIETSTYMTIKNKNLDPTVYSTQGKPWNIYSLRFENKNNNPEQIFKIEEENGWHKIIGSIDATYQSPNSGIVDTGYGTAYFNKNLSFNTFRKIKITQKAGINGYYITSEKDRNNKYGVDANKLIKDKSNNRFIFEKTTAPTIAAAEEEQKPITTGLKVEGINLDIKKVIGGLTQVSVGGSLICGINSNNKLYKWNNKENKWEKFSDGNYKHVSVGEDNIVLALGTNKKIYTRKDDKWVLFGKGIFPTIQVRKTQEDARKVAGLPTPGTLPNPSSSSTSTTLPTPAQAPSLSIVGPGGVAYFASAQEIPMKQIEIGSREHLWGLGENNNKAYMWNGSEWIDKSMGMKFNYISVGVDGTVKALDSTNKLASWTGSNWSISPFKLHQISVTNKDKHWAITKEDDGSFNVYKFVNNGYILRAKNLQQVSTNLDGTLFGISTLKTGGGFEIYARIIKLYGKILDKLNNAKSKTTVKEKIAEINKAINLAVAEKVALELTTDELNALKLETYTEIFNILTKQIDNARKEKVLKELKDLVTAAGASVLIEDTIKPLLISYAETNIKLEKETKKDETKKTTSTTAQSIRRRRRNIATTTNNRGRGGAIYRPGSGRRGRDVIPVNSVF